MMGPPRGTAGGFVVSGGGMELDGLTVLKQRADFLACARGARAQMPGFLLQGRTRDGDMPGIRVGFTASKKVGNAVARNRAKRRLRALAREVIAAEGRAGWDYVLVARAGETADRPFEQMRLDLSNALARLHATKPRPSGEAPQAS